MDDSNACINDDGWANLSQGHTDQFEDADIGTSKERTDVEIIDGGDKRIEYAGANYAQKDKAVAKSHSEATETSLRRNYESDIKANPGMESSIKGKYRKY